MSYLINDQIFEFLHIRLVIRILFDKFRSEKCLQKEIQ